MSGHDLRKALARWVAARDTVQGITARVTLDTAYEMRQAEAELDRIARALAPSPIGDMARDAIAGAPASPRESAEPCRDHVYGCTVCRAPLPEGLVVAPRSALVPRESAEGRAAARSCLWHADCDAADRALREGVQGQHPPAPAPAAPPRAPADADPCKCGHPFHRHQVDHVSPGARAICYGGDDLKGCACREWHPASPAPRAPGPAEEVANEILYALRMIRCGGPGHQTRADPDCPTCRGLSRIETLANALLPAPSAPAEGEKP